MWKFINKRYKLQGLINNRNLKHINQFNRQLTINLFIQVFNIKNIFKKNILCHFKHFVFYIFFYFITFDLLLYVIF